MELGNDFVFEKNQFKKTGSGCVVFVFCFDFVKCVGVEGKTFP